MNNKETGKVIVIVAPSGAGKTTIARKLLADYPEIKFSTSATTRPAREGEKDGREYYFLSEEEFNRKVEKGDFLEWESYSGNKYGTLQSEVDKLVESGYFPLLDIEVKGALNVQRIYDSNLVSIFIKPPSLEVLEERLTNRGSETDETLSKRLKRAEMEMQHADDFDYSVVNDDLETAYAEVKEIIESFITD
ncbi:guanylate kinase [Fodinibius halophilus]|uniref:Guanylate kinase n=1 Tax=Fodinibius halophilus TaxID=1736908 RepID=A0A6M1SWG7_9BACT|nr:guanylate kinase [Fodinibius halophilus]NGP88208.1 guanylate kinase [Fodinibius halophilus]